MAETNREAVLFAIGEAEGVFPEGTSSGRTIEAWATLIEVGELGELYLVGAWDGHAEDLRPIRKGELPKGFEILREVTGMTTTGSVALVKRPYEVEMMGGEDMSSWGVAMRVKDRLYRAKVPEWAKNERDCLAEGIRRIGRGHIALDVEEAAYERWGIECPE